MGVRVEPGPTGDPIVVEHEELPVTGVGRVVVAAEAERVA
jgi:hypothetical protein